MRACVPESVRDDTYVELTSSGPHVAGPESPVPLDVHAANFRPARVPGCLRLHDLPR